jgi:flagellar biosynthesis/type III secretory pathway chaperone
METMDEMSASLVAVLEEQIACAQAMLASLGRENDALVAGDAEGLNAASAEKAHLVDTLDKLEHERRALSDAIRAIVGDDAGANRADSPAWHTLLGLIEQCKTQNQRNGALVKARSEQVRIALEALRGSEPTFYEPGGLKPSLRSARELGTA